MVLISLRSILPSRKYKKVAKHSHLKTTIDERQKRKVNDITNEKGDKSATMKILSPFALVVLMLALRKLPTMNNKKDRIDDIRTTLEDG